MYLFIHHCDLRITDNNTLNELISNNEEFIPIFIFTPEQIEKSQNKYFSSNSVQFMIESLLELKEELFDNLKFYYGDTLEILNKLNKLNPINSIGFNFDYTPYAKKRDLSIINWAEENNIKIYCALHNLLLYTY